MITNITKKLIADARYIASVLDIPAELSPEQKSVLSPILKDLALQIIRTDNVCDNLRAEIQRRRDQNLDKSNVGLELDDKSNLRSRIRFLEKEREGWERERKQLTKKIEELTERKDTYKLALRDLFEVTSAICGEECCDYGHSDVIARCGLIAENKRKCHFASVNKQSGIAMCKLHGVFCNEGRFPACKGGCTLFPGEDL